MSIHNRMTLLCAIQEDGKTTTQAVLASSVVQYINSSWNARAFQVGIGEICCHKHQHIVAVCLSNVHLNPTITRIRPILTSFPTGDVSPPVVVDCAFMLVAASAAASGRMLDVVPSTPPSPQQRQSSCPFPGCPVQKLDDFAVGTCPFLRDRRGAN